MRPFKTTYFYPPYYFLNFYATSIYYYVSNHHNSFCQVEMYRQFNKVNLGRNREEDRNRRSKSPSKMHRKCKNTALVL